MTTKIIRLFIAFLLGILSQQIFAAKDYIIERTYFEDKTAQLNFEDARRQIYEPMGSMLAKGYSASAFWIRLKIDGVSTAQLGEKLILRIQPSYLDEIQLFDLLAPSHQPRIVGDYYPVDNNEYSSLNFSFVVPKSKQDRYVWLRVKTTSTNFMQVLALTPEDCAHLDRIQEFGFSFYFAILFLLFLFPAFIWIAKREFLVGVFVVKQFGAITYLFFSAGYFKILFKDLDLQLLQLIVNFNLLAYSLITMFFHYIFLSEYKMRSWARGLFFLAISAFPIELLLLVFKLDRYALHLNMVVLNLMTLSFLVIPAYGIDWKKTGQVVFGKKTLILIHLLISLSAISTTLPSLGYLQGNSFSPFFTLAYGGITGIIFLSILYYRYRLVREDSIARVSSAEAYAHAERERREQQGQFLAMLTHELKTPLSVMKMGYSSAHQSAKMKKYIQMAIDDMADVIDRCVMDDKLQNQGFQLNNDRCNLNELIAEKVQQYDDLSRIQILESNGYTIYADIQLLRICINNLIDNAIKYGDDKSPVVVGVTDSAKKGWVTIFVRNTVGSIGVPDFEKIFDKYYRSPRAYEKTGSGLGLYLVKNFVELMSGEIKCHQDANQIIFSIHLPTLEH